MASEKTLKLQAWSREDANERATRRKDSTYKCFAAEVFQQPNIAVQRMSANYDRHAPAAALALMAGWEPGCLADMLGPTRHEDVAFVQTAWKDFVKRHTQYLLIGPSPALILQMTRLRLTLEGYRFCNGQLPGIEDEYLDRVASFREYEPTTYITASSLHGSILGDAAMALLRGEDVTILTTPMWPLPSSAFGEWAQRCRELGHTQIKPICVEHTT